MGIMIPLVGKAKDPKPAHHMQKPTEIDATTNRECDNAQ